MNRTLSSYEFYDDDDDFDHRRSRLQDLMGTENGSAALRERAASQPPRATGDTHPSILPSPTSQHHMPSSLGGPWPSSRNISGRGQSTQIRSSSYTSQSHSNFGSAMRDRPFPSTYEDDESEALSDTYDDRYFPSSLIRGRPTLNQDSSKSRSQSLAPGRQGPIGTIPLLNTTSAMQSRNESYLSSVPARPSGTSRHGPLAINIAVGRPDVSNMSPLTRDLGQILLDDGPFRELWAGMNPPRDEVAGGGGNGTTSRRHSVSVAPRRVSNVIGFNAPSTSELTEEQKNRSLYGSAFSSSSVGNGSRSGGLMLSDDDLAIDLGQMNLGPSTESKSHQQPPSQPASLPIFAPHSRSPVATRDLLSPYQSINLSIPPANTYSRQVIGTPSDNGYDATNDSPSISSSVFEQRLAEARTAHQQQQQADLRFQLLQQQQHLRSRAPSYSGTSGLQSPISPTRSRIINPQQPPYYPQTRKFSEGHVHQQQSPTLSTPLHPHTPNLAELGKGLPLHSVPPSWPLFIVEFKAGRTDLFYLPPPGTHSGLEWDNVSPDRDIRVGDLVIVEADRGKDLGKVVNDRITLEEVEAFQRMQAEKAPVAAAGISGQGEPTSPGGLGQSDGSGASHTKKDINPKLIYGKAVPQDVQLYAAKTQDEIKALQLCQSKVRAKKLPMEVIDAEYQWCVSPLSYLIFLIALRHRDRRKLTFYFIAEKRIDFRELVRELFRYALVVIFLDASLFNQILDCTKRGYGWRRCRVG